MSSHIGGRGIVSKALLDQHRTMVRGVNDVIWQPLYDFNTYVGTTGHTELLFFQSQKGQGTTSAPGATGLKTLADTNMAAAGQLGKGNEFYMTGIEVLFYPGVEPGRGSVALADVGEFVDDVWTFMKSGILTMTVGTDRVYVQDSPLAMFPPCTRLALNSAISTTNDSDSTSTSVVEEIAYAVCSGEPYNITPLYIESNQTFGVSMTWPAAQVLPTGQNARVGVRLRGYLIRNAQ